jgi:arginine kinase
MFKILTLSSLSFFRNKSEMVDAAVLEKLEAGYAKLAASDSKSLLKKFLTKEIFDSLKNKKTPTFGSTLLDVIQSGLENHDSGVGIYAPDSEVRISLNPPNLFKSPKSL